MRGVARAAHKFESVQNAHKSRAFPSAQKWEGGTPWHPTYCPVRSQAGLQHLVSERSKQHLQTAHSAAWQKMPCSRCSGPQQLRKRRNSCR